MKFWIVQDGEPLPGLDKHSRDWRSAMLAKVLAARGHEVTWWASNFSHFSKRYYFPTPREFMVQPNLRIQLLQGPGYKRNKSLRRWIHNRILAKALAREAPRFPRPSLIFCSLPTLELAEESVLLGQKMSVPVLVDVRDLWPDHYLTLFPWGLRGPLRRIFVLEFRRLRRITRGGEGIVSISNAYLNWALKHAGREKNLADGVYPMGYPIIDSSAKAEILLRKKELTEQYKLRPEDFVVVFVGSFTSSFDFHTVVKAARSLDRLEKSNIRFILVGEGKEGRRMRRWARGTENITFAGWLDQTSISAILDLASVGLAPYRRNTTISLPNKPFEYMSAGLPLLSSLPGETESLIIGERIGLQYQAGNPASLAAKIRWLAAQPDVRKKMGARSLQLFRERFSAEVVYPSLAKHLEDVAKRGHLSKMDQ